MRTSPKTMAIVYFAMGILFIFIAVRTTEDTVWNFSTIVLAVIATLDFGVAIRLMSVHYRLKNKNKKE
ncbi:YdiK family protein [Virgibacillus ndiopensis]|uniref:YdiK family protein n=1 Tax=Virgibacillus ndiopensis TaxID=2004408 RepID=UPI000C07E366|nr:YdiK family protein [Virgibacillus ndiopensis]